MSDLQRQLAARVVWTQRALWLLPFALLAWLLWRHAAPGGRLTVTYDLNEQAPPALLQQFAPREAVRLMGSVAMNGVIERFQEITQEPLTFAVPALRRWQRATIRLRYENPDAQPVLRVSVKRQNGTFHYFPFAAYEPRLDSLPAFWVPVRTGMLTLWQRHPAAYEAFVREQNALEEENKKRLAERRQLQRAAERLGEEMSEDELPQLLDVPTAMRSFDLTPFLREPLRYDSVATFLQDPPSIDRILRFNVELSDLAQLPGYRAARERTAVDTAVRGSHTITAFVGENENLDFQFALRDSNRNKGDDAVSVTVSRGTKELSREELADDDDASGSGKPSDERMFRVFFERPGAGVYHIAFTTSDDVFFTRFDTQQQRFYFEGHVYLADHEEYRALLPGKTFTPTQLWTDATTLTAATAHRDALQTLTVGRRPVELTAPHQNANIRLSGLTSVLVPKNDVYLEGGGFAFSKEALFAGQLERPALFQDVEMINDFDYIIAQYPAPKRLENGLDEAVATIAAPELTMFDGAYVFGISMPGLTERNRRLRLYELSVTFERVPITFGNVLSRFRGLLNRSPATNASPVAE